MTVIRAALPLARYDDGRGPPVYLMEQPVIFGSMTPNGTGSDASRAPAVPAQQRPTSYPAMSQALAGGAASASSFSLNLVTAPASASAAIAQRLPTSALTTFSSPLEELFPLQDVLIRWLCLFLDTPLSKSGDPNSNFTVYVSH